MKKAGLILVLAVLGSIVIAEEEFHITDEEKKLLKPKVQHIQQCTEGYPYLGAGDFNLTAENFTK